MPARIVADPRTLNAHAGELGTVSAQFEQEVYRLREALGFLLNRPDIPNGAALMSSYMTALQSLDSAAASSRQLAVAVTRHARRVVDCENAYLRNGDGPYARALPGRGRGGGSRSGGLPGWLKSVAGVVNTVDNAFDNVVRGAKGLDKLHRLPAMTLKGKTVGGRKVLDLLNYGDEASLRAVNGISDDGAAAIIAARRNSRFRTPQDVLRVLADANADGDSKKLMQTLRRKTGGGSLDTLGPLGKRLTPLVARMRLAKAFDAGGDAAFRVGTVARRFAPATKFLGKVLAPVDVVGSGWAFGKEWRDHTDDPDLMGGENVELAARGTAVVVAVTGAAVVVGVIASPIVAGAVVVAGVGLVVYEYGPRAWKAGTRWAGDAKDWVGDRAGDAKDYVSGKAGDAKEWAGDTAGDVKDAVTDKADDVKDAVSDKADDAKDWAGSKASSAKKKISGWLPG